ncbi:helix-turn-helix domain-containing protein [uncultured Cohaesibacter sp.]|uniref:winged helix-turn-helix transcriptional regulator n=1 Tax=uncultured Cohaesibacter sp. TaxID=1002546 RepID=UPI002A0A200D|nr:helix-turn-helix domain-containing protein [uncultured Cohaesibacter sp.]
MAIPRPGNPVRGSQSGAPVMATFDLLGRRWAMGIIWHLNKGPATFRALQEHCETISPSILNSRLKDLREAGLIEKTPQGYALTALGDELYALLQPLADWSIRWAEELSQETDTDFSKCK